MHFIHKSLEETMIKVAMNKRKKNMAAAISKADKELKGKNSAEVIESWKDVGINLATAIKVTLHEQEPCDGDEKL